MPPLGVTKVELLRVVLFTPLYVFVSYRELHLVAGTAYLLVLSKLDTEGVKLGGINGDVKLEGGKLLLYSPILLFGVMMSCFLSRKGTCSCVVMELVNLHSIGGINTVPSAAVD